VTVKLLSVAMWSYAVLSMIVMWLPFAPLWLLSLPFDRRRRFAHSYASHWANHLHRVSPLWDIVVDGLQHFDPDRAYVLAANHESTADILVAFALRRQFRWIAKAELFFVPLLGWMMAMTGCVPIRRGDPNSRRKMMTNAARQLAMGNSVLVFPEGTRSVTGELLPFKRGAFELACATKTPVLPVLIEGTGALLPKNAWFAGVQRKTHPVMRVLAPIDPATHGLDPTRLATAVRAEMTRQRELLRQQIKQRGGVHQAPRNAEPAEHC
jgi:1-acyl-sn-glycerol-3-phosphate acyltransferase